MQYNAGNAVNLNNGGFNNNNKNNSYQVVPLFDCYEYGDMTYDVLLEKVYEAYYDCRKKKRNKQSMLEFELDYERHVRELTDDLYNGTYEIGRSIAFAVTRPKLREVFAASPRDRVVHHLLINEIGGIIDGEMIDDSFSCRVGKGVTYGQMRLREQIIEVSDNYKEEAYTLCIDISGFFMSISKERLSGMIEETLREKYEGEDLEFWLELTRKIVLNHPELNCEIHGDKRLLDALPDNKTLFRSKDGVPIGNLTSQIFGNFYLTPFDWWSIAYLGTRGEYCRYVDDIRASSKDKGLLLRYKRDSEIWLRLNYGVTLHPTKWSLQEVHKGVRFIGAVIKPWGIYAGNRLVNNAFAAARSKDDTEKYVIRMNSYFGFLIHDLTYAIRWRLWKSIPEERKAQLVCYNMSKLKARQHLNT